MSGQTRRRFHDDLAALERRLLEMGELVAKRVPLAVSSLIEADVDLARSVIDGDDDIDEMYVEIESAWLKLLALQTPVAGDLRLLSAILHMNKTLERMGDQAANIAKLAERVQGRPASQTILDHLEEMASHAIPMIRASLTAFATRDVEAALALPRMDDPLDRLYRDLYHKVAECADDVELLEWAILMMLVARALERVGDQAVDIGEQLAFLLTGQFRELNED